MERSETRGKSLLEGAQRRWSEAFSIASGYCAWLLLWPVFSFFLFVAGATLIRWGLGDIEVREAGLALGLGLATWGWLLILVSGIAVWVKVSTISANNPA